MNKLKALHMITWVLIIIGGLNWGLAVFGYDIASWGFFSDAILKVIYALVGLSALYELFTHGKRCRMCNPDGSKTMSM